MNRFLVWILPLALMLGWIAPAQAGEIVPIEGQDYWILPKCDVGTCVKIAPNINLSTPLFAAQLKTTPYDIRRDNPMGTIALCRNHGGRYRSGIISKPEDRKDDSVWASCPNPADQYVYVLPGQTIKITGVAHLPFPEQQRILKAIQECKTQECVDQNTARLNPGVKRTGSSAPAPTTKPTAPPPSPPASASAGAGKTPAAGSTGATVIEVTRMPVWGWWVMGLLSAISVVFIALYWRLVAKMMDIVNQQVRFIQQNAERSIKLLKDQLESLHAKFNAQGVLLAAASDEAAEQNKKFTEIRKSLLDHARKEMLPVPQTASLLDIWSLVSQRFSEIARENGEVRDAKVRLEKSLDESERKRDELQATLDNQVRINGDLTTKLIDRKAELQAAKSSIDDLRRNCDRINELHGLLAPQDAQLIEIDNGITSLSEPHQAKLLELQALEEAGDPKADVLRPEVQAMESRIRHLYGRHDALLASTKAWRVEFNNLSLQLIGFELDGTLLYEEAQRDRNDAAKEKGEASAMLAQAQSIRENVQVELKLLETQLRANLDEQFAEREAQLQTKIDELVDRELVITEREASQRGKELPSGSEEFESLGQRLTEAMSARDSAQTALERSQADVARLEGELAEQKVSNANLIFELSEARANSRRFQSELSKLSEDLDAARAEVSRLDDELTGIRLKTPAPVPVILPISTPPARPTMPYIDPASRSGGIETFFSQLSILLTAPTRLVVDTPQKAWLLHDLMNNLRIDIRLEDLFPAGPQSSSHASGWERLRADFRVTTLDSIAYIVTELGLPPPHGYRPLALAGGT